MNPGPAVRHAKVKFLSVWGCRACGKVCAGDTVTAEFEYMPSYSDLRKHQRAHHMPVGWASYGTEGVECPDHSKE